MPKGIIYSVILHIIVWTLLFSGRSNLLDKKPAPSNDKPIIIDLKNVEIARKTNIPKKKKVEKKEEKKEKPKKEKKKEAKKKSVAAPLKKVEPVADPNAISDKTEEAKKEEQKMPPKDFTPPKRPKSLVKNRKPPKENKKKKEEDDPLKSLLASVEKMENEVKADKPKKENEEEKKDEDETDITAPKITISEIDAIRSQIKQCWNIDPGARGIADMVVEITVSLASDGSVIETSIVDKARYNSDSFFRSLADSARRAIHICSPLKVPTDKYETWKDMRLYFNPLNGGVL